jgi:3D (Asp-Asp-Asp) domain-containing protein
MKLINWIMIIIVIAMWGVMSRCFERLEWQSEIIALQDEAIAKQKIIINEQSAVNSRLKELLASKYQKDVTITAYTASARECDADPDHNAIMETPEPGTVAVSRDLYEAGWTFGKRVYVPGHGVLRIADLMNKRYQSRIDIFMGRIEDALQVEPRVVKASLIKD